MPKQSSLSWGLIVATYQREKVLPLCLRLAMEQTRPPIEVVVIDASEDWEHTRRTIMETIAIHYPYVKWTYDPAQLRSICAQRNQAMEHATADILFFMDDDSLMYPTCAEEIMRVYEADEAQTIVGVQGAACDNPPIDTVSAGGKKLTGSHSENPQSGRGVFHMMRDWIWRNVLLMDATKLFLPYDGNFPQHSVPGSMRGLNVAPTRLFQGYRMTYRRNVIERVRFDAVLRYYAAGEDLDASYRASRHGPLLVALNSKLHHYQSASGRLSRYKVTVLALLNQAVLLRKNASDLPRMKRRYYARAFRRMAAEAIKDGLSRRWSLPQFRGVVVALFHSRKVFSVPADKLGDWYGQFQQAFLE